MLIALISTANVIGLRSTERPGEPLVVVAKGKYGYIDHEGRMMIRPQYVWAEDFFHGLGTVYVCGRYVSIDASGKLLPLRIAEAGKLSARKRGEKYGFVVSSGAFKIEARYDDVLPFSDGLAAVKIGDKWGFIDTAGHQVIAPQFHAAFYFREGVAAAEQNSEGPDVLIDKSGKVLASGFSNLAIISEGRVPVSREGKSGFLDLQGRIVIPLAYDFADSFHGGLAAVEKEGKFGYIDRDGNAMIPFDFDKAGAFSSGLAPAKLGSKTGFIDKSGKFAFYLAFSEAAGFFTGDDDDLFLAESDVSRFWTEDRKFGYVKKDGRVIWGPAVGVPDHPPLLGWSDEEKAESCRDIPQADKSWILELPDKE